MSTPETSSTPAPEKKLFGRSQAEIAASRAKRLEKIAAAEVVLKQKRDADAAASAHAAHKLRLANSAVMRSQQNLFLQRAFGSTPPLKKQ